MKRNIKIDWTIYKKKIDWTIYKKNLHFDKSDDKRQVWLILCRVNVQNKLHFRMERSSTEPATVCSY